ncbi:MAG: RT0821/Lpp0805 family surface protein [Methyloceanibacter sp.]
MRTFRWNAPIVGAGALLVSILAPASHPLKAEERGAQATTAATAPAASGLNELRTRLDQSDRQAAYQALQLALDELGDGVTLVWKRPARGLVGKIKPVSAFRDDKGRVCRHLLYSLSLGGYEKEIEGNACREADGSWALAG